MAYDKWIFITGGASGIGRAVAQEFGRRGWGVGLADVNDVGLRETAAMLPEGAASIHQLDVRDRAQWQAALDEFGARSGGQCHVLFNNAGVAFGGPIGEAKPEELDLLIDVNLRGVVNGAIMALPMLKATPGSCLLNTASASALYGISGMAVYSATKFAVRGFTEALDIEWAAHGIKVRSLMPGFIDTPLLHAPPSANSNGSMRDSVVQAGLEFTPVETVAQLAWDAVHGKAVHQIIGKTARKLAFAARYMPGSIRKKAMGIMAKG